MGHLCKNCKGENNPTLDESHCSLEGHELVQSKMDEDAEILSTTLKVEYGASQEVRDSGTLDSSLLGKLKSITTALYLSLTSNEKEVLSKWYVSLDGSCRERLVCDHPLDEMLRVLETTRVFGSMRIPFSCSYSKDSFGGTSSPDIYSLSLEVGKER